MVLYKHQNSWNEFLYNPIYVCIYIYIDLHKYISILQDQLKKDTLFSTRGEWLFTISFVAAWPRLHALGVSIGKIDRPVRYGMLSVPRNPEGRLSCVKARWRFQGFFQEMNRKFSWSLLLGRMTQQVVELRSKKKDWKGWRFKYFWFTPKVTQAREA